MVKTKNKKGASSDHYHIQKEPKKLNSFEVHVNKEKLKVIGRKQKNDRGLPGISRAKAIQKRKSTLLEEYKVQNKNNMFLDRRIGEKVNMDSESKVIARFTALKMKSHSKRSIFNLADDTILTHRGQTLSEIEKFDDPKSEDDFSDDENQSGKLDTNFVREAHFGGGILKNTGQEGAMTHKDLINQLIFESKKRKAEKQKAKEATLELTEKLDLDWKDLIPLVTKDGKNKEEIKKPKVDDYDKIMRELKFEKRGTVSDRLKTEGEIAKEEMESLEILEQERIKRMNNHGNDDKPKLKHRSADDLDDDFVYDDDDNDCEENMLSYNKEGESNIQIQANVNGTVIKTNVNALAAEEDQDGEDQETDEDDGSKEELETDSEDNLSDLKISDNESDEENCNINENIQLENDTIITSKEASSKTETVNNNNESTEEETENLEIPFTFKLPDTYKNLLSNLEKYEGYQHLVIERMIKCNHPSLSEQNQDKLGLLFAYLLQYLNDLFSDDLQKDDLKKHFKIFQLLVPQIYSLAQLNNQNAHNSMLEVIKEKYEDYKKKHKTHPGLEVLIFLKLVSVLFPTSDFRHQVVTPCYVLMEMILTKCRVQNRKQISYGMFISSLILEYTALSKRYLPAVINYLSGLLHMMIPKSSVKLLKIPPPFKSTSTLLVLQNNYSLESLNSLKLNSGDFSEEEITSEYQVRVLHNIVKILQQFLEHYIIHPSHVEIFEKVTYFLEKIPLNNYPREVQNNVKCLLDELKKSKIERSLKYLVLDAFKPKALRLYEPKIQVVYDGKHKRQSKEKAHINKLLHKVKREKKGALREIRRDNAFLGRFKISKQLQSDKERKEKVKRIYSEAAMQQSELNEIDRKKKRKK